MYVVDVAKTQVRAKIAHTTEYRKAKASTARKQYPVFALLGSRYQRRDGVRRTRCSTAIQFLYFVVDHVLRFGLWLVLNYRYGLPFWFAVAASFVVLNVTLFK